MTPQEFRRAVDLGMGRAARVVLANDPTPYLDELVGACLVNGQHDPMFEDNRAPYLARLLSLAGAEERALRAILRVFPTSEKINRRLQTRLLILLSKRGYRQAEETLYAHAREDDEIADEIAKLGVSGIQWLIAHRPHLITEGREFQMHCWLEDAAQDSGQEWLDAVLDISGPLGAKIRELAAYKPTGNQSEREMPTLEQVLSGPVRHWPQFGHYFARTATEDEVMAAAEALLVNDEIERVASLARVFWHRPWPMDPSLLFAKTLGDDRGSRACRSILQMRHPAIREEALLRLSAEPVRFDAVSWLTANYEDGDEELLIGIARKAASEDPQKRHELQIDLLAFAASNLLSPVLAPTTVELLEWCVENGPCSFCRFEAYRHLSEGGALKLEYQAEIRYDAEEETRKLAG